MKKELNIFWNAIMFYTRIPCPKNIESSDEFINKSSRYFPLVGWIIGIVSFSVFTLSSFVFNNELSVVFAIMSGVLVTGAFHEDGLADFFDGFGGGWTKEQILNIMKDSRVGTFGAIALIFLFLLKFLTLQAIVTDLGSSFFHLGLIFITFHSLSRLTAITLAFTNDYVRDENSKSKPLAKSNSREEVFFAFLFGLLPFVGLLFHSWIYVAILPLLALIHFYFRWYLNKWIGGYTGDCLGAVEQICEIACLLIISVLCKFMF